MTNSITKNIALFYGEREKVDALETYDDLMNELESWGYTPTKKGKRKISVENVSFTFHNIEENDVIFHKGDFFEKIYMANRLKDFEFPCVTISEKIIYHPYPFQSLIDMVLDVKGKTSKL